MNGLEMREFSFANDLTHALVAYLIGRYKVASSNKLGRTILQKLCYFAKASGVPLPFRFEIYHYGPFSQEVFQVTEALLVDEVIKDLTGDSNKSDYAPDSNWHGLIGSFEDDLGRYKAMLDRIAETFSALDPSQMELVSTIHYIHNSHSEWAKKTPSKGEVVESVLSIKKAKFDRNYISRVYDILDKAGLLCEREDAVTPA